MREWPDFLNCCFQLRRSRYPGQVPQTTNGQISPRKSPGVEESRQFVSHVLKKMNKLHRRCDRFSALNALRFPFSKTMRYRCPSEPGAIAMMVPNSPSWFVPTIRTESPTLNSSDSLLMTSHFYSVSWMTTRRF